MSSLVQESQYQNLRAVERLLLVVQSSSDGFHGEVRHIGVHFTSQFDETRAKSNCFAFHDR